MGIFSAARYVKYLIFFRHRRGHGIHSPFVFKLVSEIFRNKTGPDIVCCIEKIRERLLADPRSITVNDFGAGSGKMKTSLRKVSDIARYSAVPEKYGVLLSNMAKAFGEPVILEFGTSLGISTMYMAVSCPGATVITMEGCSETSDIAAYNFREAGLNNIRVINGSFDEILPELRSEKICPGLVFIDGNHRKTSLISYFNQIADISCAGSVVIIDDINSSREMAEAWYTIRNNKNVTLTVDI
ncbi:MAG: class I SAM-dependent methyltransferase, partial [Bacteroidia bacterium]